jgi:hypothetical protein
LFADAAIGSDALTVSNGKHGDAASLRKRHQRFYGLPQRPVRTRNPPCRAAVKEWEGDNERDVVVGA